MRTNVKSVYMSKKIISSRYTTVNISSSTSGYSLNSGIIYVPYIMMSHTDYELELQKRQEIYDRRKRIIEKLLK